VGQLSGRIAIITGASKGIGRVASRVFAREGATVVCAARSADLVHETVSLVADEGGQALAVIADLSREEDARRLVSEAVAAFGRVDCLVNNAGDGGPTRAVQDYTTGDWFSTINSCLTSSYLCARFAVPPMIEAGGGAIVNIASMAARRGLPYRVGYCAAKAGQIGLTYGLALELGRHNIRVNAVIPGAVEGERIERVIAAQAELRGIGVEQQRKTFIDRSPLKRMATPEDIAWAALFLCTDRARNISGQCLPVNAGEPAS
jgi:NAD(P)-dependent dehydrogenase (short-subunit alcohol dehydrogenase family)